jgi:cell division protein FtsA
MNEELKFETYLFIDSKKLVICVIEKKTLKILFKEEKLLDDHNEDSNLKKLDNFLAKNIFKIEKILKNFVKDINIILDDKEFFPIEISIKKDHNGNSISQENLINPLNVLKNLCQFSFKDKKIIHMLIENYQIDGKDYSFLPENLKCNNFSLDIKFICLSKNLIEHYESILKKYHILVNQILNAEYIEQFQDLQNPNIYTTASRIISGYNNNEISLVNKTLKSKGFFEKFFDLFS